MASVCNSSQDDSSDNALSPAILISEAGLNGRHFTGGSGIDGDRLRRQFSEPDNRRYDATRGGRLAQRYCRESQLWRGPRKALRRPKNSVAKAITRLSESQASKVAGMRMADQFTTLANCGLQKNIAFAGPIEGINPLENPAVAKLGRGHSPKKSVAWPRSRTTFFSVIVEWACTRLGGCANYHQMERGRPVTLRTLKSVPSIGLAVAMAAETKAATVFRGYFRR
jgi:TfoX/Sxy family transcriptional regulator of competence genes